MRRALSVGIPALLVLGVVGALVVGSGSDGTDRESTTTIPDRSPATPAEPEDPEPQLADHAAVAEAPKDANELATTIAAAEDAIRGAEPSDPDLEDWAHIQQAAYRSLARRPEWLEAIMVAVGSDLAGVVERNVLANRELWALTDPRESLPDWTIVEPPPAEELLAHYRAAEAEFGIPWPYLAAIHLVESRMGRIRGDSVAGARGPMQFLPATWDAYGEGDIDDPADAIRAAARYLDAHGGPEDMAAATYAYNHSDHYVTAIRAYVEVMDADERAYYGYYHWQVYYRLVTGDVILDVGWTSD